LDRITTPRPIRAPKHRSQNTLTALGKGQADSKKRLRTRIQHISFNCEAPRLKSELLKRDKSIKEVGMSIKFREYDYNYLVVLLI